MPSPPDPTRAERLELILQQVDALPTLSPVALRLLKLSADDSADIKEIVSLVEADGATTGRLLSLCRSAATGLGDSITTVERAVVMLGFDAVRSALLSVHLHDLMAGRFGAEVDEPADADGASPTIDRSGLWRHALAVACAAELIAEAHRSAPAAPGSAPTPPLKAEEAFVCGLLHDLGKHALDAILPKTYARVARLAEQRQINIADVERTLIGLDHHTVGKRLGEQWGLPHALQDVMWLHGQPASTVPDLPHRRLIGVVTVADAVARSLHVGWSGDFSLPPELAPMCREWDLDPERVARTQARLHERVGARTRGLGLEAPADAHLALESVLAANRRLGALNAAMQERSRAGAHQGQTLGAIAAFHAAAPQSRTLTKACADVARSAAELMGPGAYTIVHQARAGQPWQICRCDHDGRILRHDSADPPKAAPDLAAAADRSQLSAISLGLMAWLGVRAGDAYDPGRMRILTLVCGADRPSLLIHDRDVDSALMRGPALEALTATWAAAIASAAHHDGARRLGEQLADVNRRLVETQTQLTEARAIGMLVEVAAGAAHEMNNPLTVISGRTQALASRLSAEEDRAAARSIAEAASKLSDLITSLHFFAKPPSPQMRATNLVDLLSRAVRDFKLRRVDAGQWTTPVKLVLGGPASPIWVDPAQIGDAVTELLQNAFEAGPTGFVELRAQLEPPDDRLVISVRDDGCGMSDHALRHAFDPFFSEKKAGRQRGLGLARARRLVDMHSGRIELDSAPGAGTTARIILPRWRPAESDEEAKRAA